MNEEAKRILEDVKSLKVQVLDDGQKLLDQWSESNTRSSYSDSLRNLAYYMAFRQYDHREIQNNLMEKHFPM